MIELTAIARKASAEVEQCREGLLHHRDSFPNSQPTAHLFTQHRCRGEVIGMSVGLKQPFGPKTPGA